MAPHAINAYRSTEVTTADPLQLILLLYDAGIQDLFRVREGIRARDHKKIGEHLGRAIEILNELIRSLKDDPEDESVQFLNGLYDSIIRELGRVVVTHDTKTVDTAIKYLAQLREIWKKHVMAEERGKNRKQASAPAGHPEPEHLPGKPTYSMSQIYTR